MDNLYLFKIKKQDFFKIGVTSDIHKIRTSIESTFGMIDNDESIIYSCDNHDLIIQIKNGVNAYLFNYYISPSVIGSGVTECFNIDSFDKCLEFLNIYVTELSNFKKIGRLTEVLKVKSDVNKELEQTRFNIQFMQIHSKMSDLLHDFIVKHKDSIKYEKQNGTFVLSNIDTIDLEILDLPDFKWVRKDDNKIIFDISIFNDWKKRGVFKDVRKVIEMKYFNEFSFKNLTALFK